jgi:hypothetical protein
MVPMVLALNFAAIEGLFELIRSHMGRNMSFKISRLFKGPWTVPNCATVIVVSGTKVCPAIRTVKIYPVTRLQNLLQSSSRLERSRAFLARDLMRPWL